MFTNINRIWPIWHHRMLFLLEMSKNTTIKRPQKKNALTQRNENDFSVAKENPIKIEHSEIAEKRIAKKCEQIEL